MTEPVHAVREGRALILTLDRPRALNALDNAMVATLASGIALAGDDPAIQAILIESAGERAFCAGGDVRAARDWVLSGQAGLATGYFAAEYALNLAIATAPKPIVALVDGICMGGGCGLSVHAAACIASEHAVFAMPEMAIGFLPDVGASHFLPRLPGALGIWIALTGARLKGADAVHAGLATHFVPRHRLAALRAAVIADGPRVVPAFAETLPPDTNAAHRAAIQSVFGAPDPLAMLARLAEIDSPWARETETALRAASPSALCWSHALLRLGAHSGLAACLGRELALARRVVTHPDFAEGIRAVMVDKDRAPRWTPGTLEQVDRESLPMPA